MIIIKVMGGLGNQMFQYSFYQLLMSLGREVKLDISGYERSDESGEKRKLELELFPNVEMKICTEKERAQYIDDSHRFIDRVKRKLRGNKTDIYREANPYQPEILKIEDGYLLGYWTCEKYYEGILGRLKRCFQFPADNDERNAKAIDQISSTESVSMHIRRGDYLSPRYFERFGKICSDKYYKSAMHYIEQSVDKPHYFIFSDDTEYVKAQFQGSNITIIDWNDSSEKSIYDMKLMSLCKHNICANSTFSKWGAILNENPEAIRICSKKHTSDEIIEEAVLLDLWRNWVFVDEEGTVIERVYSNLRG